MSAAETVLVQTLAPAAVPDPPAEPPPRATLLNIQALRALAALMVVFVHIEALAVMAGLGQGAFEFGNAGVDLFFVISGFIMVFTTGRKPVGPLAFLGARVRRIAPLYWSVTLAVAAVAVLAPSLLQNTQADPPHLISSLLFVPMARADGAMRPVVFVGWTLNFEMAFYVLFSLGLLFRRRWAGVTLTFAALLAAVVWGAVRRPDEPLLAFYTTPMILEFGFGMLLGLVWPWLRLPSWGGAVLAGAAALAFAVVLAAPSLWPGGERLFAFGIPAAVIVAACLALERGGLALRWRWTRVLGNASYAIYLSHFFVTQAVILAAGKLGLHGAPAAVAAGLVAFAGVATVGVALHYTLERGADRAIGLVLRRGGGARLGYR